MFYSSFLIVLLINLVKSADYCDKKLCQPGKKHVACGNAGQFASSCPTDRADIPLSAEMQSLIVRLHNKYRNEVASGSAGFKPAARMLTTTWDPELAHLASLNVKTCVIDHDSCRGTQQFLYAGQNLCLFGEPYKFKEISDTIENSMKEWYIEKEFTTQKDIDKCCRKKTSDADQTGHFTALVNERQKRVGCAASQYSKNGYHYALFACNYAFTNMLDIPVYKSGPPASGCTSGKNPEFPALCSVNENYDINNIW